MNDPADVVSLAVSFATTTRIELEDLLQEARIAYWQAVRDPSYDPRKASMRTFAALCVRRHLCTVADKHQRKFPDTIELLNSVPDIQPTPEHAAGFSQLLRSLPDDGKYIVELALGLDGVPASKVRKTIRQMLSNRWSMIRFERAWRDVVLAFAE